MAVPLANLLTAISAVAEMSASTIAVSALVSNACSAFLMSWLSGIVKPVNVPKFAAFRLTPVNATSSLLISFVRPAPIIKIVPFEACDLVINPIFCTFSVAAVGLVVVKPPAVESI